MSKEVPKETATDLRGKSPQPPTTMDLSNSIQKKFMEDTLPALVANEEWRRDSTTVTWEPSFWDPYLRIPTKAPDISKR